MKSVQREDDLGRLAVLVLERELADMGIRNVVARLRAASPPVHWRKIGEALEVSAQAAQQKYGPLL